LQLAVKNVDTVTRTQIAELPRWLQPSVKEALVSLEQSKYFSAKSLIALFPQAVTKAFSVLIFLFSAFYFLKDGNKFISLLLRFVSLKKRSDISSLLTEIADVFGKYLRGQIFLVFLVALTLFIGLSFLGVRYSLLIAIFSGFAELIPIIGPLAAWGIAGIVGLLYGSKAFTDPTQLLLFVSILYLVLRQIQDYVINPYVLGRLTKLHPLVVLFAVVLGGHFYGVLGLVMAVPFAAMIKIVLEHFFFERSQKEKIS
jgi:predicted PurR-regulated permease PerM